MCWLLDKKIQPVSIDLSLDNHPFHPSCAIRLLSSVYKKSNLSKIFVICLTLTFVNSYYLFSLQISIKDFLIVLLEEIIS